jgi:hypothetical protein
LGVNRLSALQIDHTIANDSQLRIQLSTCQYM